MSKMFDIKKYLKNAKKKRIFKSERIFIYLYKVTMSFRVVTYYRESSGFYNQ